MKSLLTDIETDLLHKMVFLSGPRQVGKTTLAQTLLKRTESGRYFNWDYDADRRAALKQQWLGEDRLLVFDELHKFPRWKNWLKGLYDVQGRQHQILVTGSARMDVYRQGGDSMLGRYYSWRMHPFTLDNVPEGMDPGQAYRRLLLVGGFPEPFLSGNERQARRWRNARHDRVLQEDVRDLESIKNIQQLRLFLDLLRSRAGGLVVLSNLAQDLHISPSTAKNWLAALERMYLVFCVYPLVQSVSRAVQKPPKVYFYDNADVHDDSGGGQLENLVATTLLKRLHYLEDHDGHRCELRYIRDKEGREVDFAVLVDGQLQELVEVKVSDERISPSLRYYADRLKPQRATQIVGTLGRSYDQDGIRVTHPLAYCGHA